MNKIEISEMLKKAIIDRNQVHLLRKRIDSKPIECIPLALGKYLLIVQYLYDFEIDGYMILRLKDISAIRSSTIEKFSEFILKEEGTLDQIKEPPVNCLDNWKLVFEQLHAIGKNIIVECESIDGGEFYIGKILQFNNNSVTLLCFNAVAEWDQEPTKIPYKEVTSVSIDKRYIVKMSKYVK